MLIVLTVIGMSHILSERIAAASENERMVVVRTLVAKIKLESSNAARYELATQLENVLVYMDRSDRDAFDPEAVDEIASLLSDDDELIRGSAAAALGLIGPPALRSVGALLKALREAAISRRIYRNTESNAMDSINGALFQLKVCVFRRETYNRTDCDYLLR